MVVDTESFILLQMNIGHKMILSPRFIIICIGLENASQSTRIIII